MIDWIEIRNFAIADHVELEFEAGFTAVTGETGAGKSLIVDALNILLGHRSDSSYIRHGEDSAELQAGFSLPEDHALHHWFAEQDIPNDGECIVRRVLRRNRASRGYVNGRAVTATQLKFLATLLVDVHGQNEHHSLLQRPNQLALLDSACGAGEAVARLARDYETITATSRRMEELRELGQSARERADLLRFQVQELVELDPGDGEWEELDARQRRLSHQQELLAATAESASRLALADDDSAEQVLLSCIARLEPLVSVDPALKPVCEMLEEARINLREAAGQLQAMAGEDELSPQALADIEQRVAAFHALARKHRVDPQQLADTRQRLAAELDGLEDPDAELERLAAELETAKEAWQSLAAEVSGQRSQAAQKLADSVTAVMQDLGMKGGRFEITLKPVEDGEVTRYGAESVEFLVSANPGMPPQPLAKVASGGELSRVSLAIQVILASGADIPTLVFDEVDVGIGGEVANVVGEKLRQLGRRNQVICVTHLPQVAARGDHHFSVSKGGDGSVASEVLRLDFEARVDEIARMTGGDRLTPESLAHAREMLAAGQ